MNLENVQMMLEDKILEFLINPQFKEEINRAQSQFNKIIQGEDMLIDFNMWLIDEYRGNDKQTFIKKYLKTYEQELSDIEKEFLLARSNSYLSLYESVGKKDHKILLEDIFTKDEVWIQMNEIEKMEKGDLLLGKIIKIADQYHVMGEKRIIQTAFRHIIERNMIEKYQTFRKMNAYGDWKDFLSQNSILLNKYVKVIDDVMVKNNDEEYKVFQSTYFVTDQEFLKDKLLELEGIKINDIEKNCFYLDWLDENQLRAELVIKDHKIEIECNNEADLLKTKKLLGQVGEKFLKHYKDEILRIEDIV